VVLCVFSVDLCVTKKELTQSYAEKHRVTQIKYENPILLR